MNKKTIVCPECAGDIELGIALEPMYEANTRYLCPCNVPLNHKTMRFLEVYKCTEFY